MRNNISLVIKYLCSDRNLALSAYLLAFSFALWPFIVSVTFIFFGFLALFHLSKPLKVDVRPIHVVLLSTLFILYLLSLAITPTPDRALELIHRISPIFLVPVLLYFSRIHLIVNYNTLRRTFILGILLSCSISFVVGIFNVIVTNDFGALLYYELSAFLHLHPTHYSLFILTAIHFLVNQTNLYLVKFRIPILLFFGVFIFLLQVKIALVGLFLYFLLYVIIYKKGSLNRRKFLLTISVLIILISIGSQLEVNRFNEIFKNRNSIEVGNKDEDGVHQRLWLWKQAYIQIKIKPLLGYGLGSQNSIFKWKVEKLNLQNHNSYQYSIASKEIATKNLHNQYVQTIYELGIIGGLLYLASIVILIRYGVKYEKIDFIVIFVFFLLFQLTENLLERQMGIYFYAFIITLLFFESNLSLDKNKCKEHQ